MSTPDTLDADARRERVDEKLWRAGADYCLACGALTLDCHGERDDERRNHSCCEKCEDECPRCLWLDDRRRRREIQARLRAALRIPDDGAWRGKRGRREDSL